jgi:hypothetical protein
MTGNSKAVESPRPSNLESRARITVALLAIGLLVLASISAVEYGQIQSLDARPISTTTELETSVITSTTTAATTTSLPSEAYVIFHQVPSCGYADLLPWGVTIANQSQVLPSNSKFPTNGSSGGGYYNANVTTMAFLLPNGVYNYTIMPAQGGNSTSIGPITLRGVDVTVNIDFQACFAAAG